MERFTDLAFEIRLEPLSDDFKVIQPDSVVIFVVGVDQEVGVLILFVVLYHSFEESAFRPANVVGVTLWVRTFCMADDIVLVFFFHLVFDCKFFCVVYDLDLVVLVFGMVLLIFFFILLMIVSPL